MREFAYLIGEITFKIVFFCGALVVNFFRSWYMARPNRWFDLTCEETFEFGTKEFRQGLKRIDDWSRGWILDIALSLLMFGILYLILRFISEEFSIYI